MNWLFQNCNKREWLFNSKVKGSVQSINEFLLKLFLDRRHSYEIKANIFPNNFFNRHFMRKRF